MPSLARISDAALNAPVHPISWLLILGMDYVTFRVQWVITRATIKSVYSETAASRLCSTLRVVGQQPELPVDLLFRHAASQA